MSPAVLDRQSFLGDMFDVDGARLTTGASHSTQTEQHGGLTLDDLITGVWEGLAVHGSVHCPACGGTMVSRSAARADVYEGADVHEGDCRDCGAELY